MSSADVCPICRGTCEYVDTVKTLNGAYYELHDYDVACSCDYAINVALAEAELHERERQWMKLLKRRSSRRIAA